MMEYEILLSLLKDNNDYLNSPDGFCAALKESFSDGGFLSTYIVNLYERDILISIYESVELNDELMDLIYSQYIRESKDIFYNERAIKNAIYLWMITYGYEILGLYCPLSYKYDDSDTKIQDLFTVDSNSSDKNSDDEIEEVKLEDDFDDEDEDGDIINELKRDYSSYSLDIDDALLSNEDVLIYDYSKVKIIFNGFDYDPIFKQMELKFTVDNQNSSIRNIWISKLVVDEELKEKMGYIGAAKKGINKLDYIIPDYSDKSFFSYFNFELEINDRENDLLDTSERIFIKTDIFNEEFAVIIANENE